MNDVNAGFARSKSPKGGLGPAPIVTNISPRPVGTAILVGPDISPLETNTEGKVRSRRTFPLKISVTWPVIVGAVPPLPASMTRIRPAGPIAMPRGLSSPVATTSTVTAAAEVATTISAETANARAMPTGEDDFEDVVVAGNPSSIVLPFVDVIRVFRRGESSDVGPDAQARRLLPTRRCRTVQRSRPIRMLRNETHAVGRISGGKYTEHLLRALGEQQSGQGTASCPVVTKPD